MKEIKEIQDNFEQSLDTWADILLNFEIKMEEINAAPEKYSDDAMMDVTFLFKHVIFNLGFHRKLIDENNAAELGEELSMLIKKYTGIDTKTFYRPPFSGIPN